MRYVIQRNDGAFVAPPGQKRSYTDKLQHARTFTTRESAEAERCPENEQVRRIDDLFAD